jgi:hypothetical protein
MIVLCCVVLQNGQLHVCPEDPERGHSGWGRGAATAHEQRRAATALPPAAGKSACPRQTVLQACARAVREHTGRCACIAVECPVQRYRYRPSSLASCTLYRVIRNALYRVIRNAFTVVWGLYRVIRNSFTVVWGLYRVIRNAFTVVWVYTGWFGTRLQLYGVYTGDSERVYSCMGFIQSDSERVYSCMGFIQSAMKCGNTYFEFIRGDSTKCLHFLGFSQ